MNKTEKLTLIEGTFSDEEAKEILMNIFSTKVNFHEVKNFSSIERFGEVDATAQKRIPDLKREVEKLTKILAEARATNKQITINSEINISLS
ncbi:hypothetical protein [Peijinzhouia sedimentorum]